MAKEKTKKKVIGQADIFFHHPPSSKNGKTGKSHTIPPGRDNPGQPH